MSTLNLTRYPNAINALHETKKYFSDVVEVEPDSEIVLDDREHSVDGMIELGLDHIDLQRNLHLGWAKHAKDFSRAELETRLQETFAQINAERKDLIDIHEVDEQVLRRMSEPEWLTLSTEQIEALPEKFRDKVDELREVATKLAMLSEDETIRTAAREHFAEKMELTKAAHGYLRVERQREALVNKIIRVEEEAAEDDRGLDRADEQKITRLEEELTSLSQDEVLASLDDAHLEAFQAEITRLVRKHNRRELIDRRLLVTPDIKAIINELRPSLKAGEPILLVGETGGAKTALAKYLGHHPIRGEAELVSFHGNINEYQLEGKDRLTDGSSDFSDGPLIRAMRDGRTIIFDEVNAAPDDFLTSLNIILTLKPGDTYIPKTDGGIPVLIQPGFSIIATMNEKSERYKGRVEQGADAKERWLKIKRIPYPDSDVVSGHTPPDNLALAEAVLSDEIGELAVDLPDGLLESFVRAAHETQKVFSGNFDGDERLKTRVSSGSDDRLRADKPGLKGAVLSPRRISKLLGIVRNAKRNPAGVLTRELASWVEGAESPADRALLTHILSNHTYRDSDGRLISLLGQEKTVQRSQGATSGG